MSLHFILDGYNVIRRTSKLDSDNLRESRDNLINFISNYNPQGSAKNKITIVFDGKADIIYHRDVSGIEIIFSENETADDLIRKIILRLQNKKNICLVSDDKELASSIKGFGVKILSVIDFIAASKELKIRKNNLEEAGSLNYSQKLKINQELSKLWLKDI